MLVFKSVRWKNFLSTGNKFTEIDLNKNRNTLIVGGNGSGKSTMLDAISFALFGRAHRDINKMQLINSINQKGTVVEIEFNVGNSDYLIRRCIKPTKFEIYKDDVMINQDASARDYQKLLEQNIIKMNHKAFHQIVVLGSSSFIPFMQLKTYLRRNVIEELLDINIFSKMNVILKERNSKIRDELTDNAHKIDMAVTKLTASRKYIKDLQGINTDQIDNKKDSIKVHRAEIDKLQTENGSLSKTISAKHTQAITDVEQYTDIVRKAETEEAGLKTKIKRLVKDAKFFEENDTCPTCDSELTEDVKTTHIHDIKQDAAKVSSQMENIKTSLKTFRATLQTNQEELKVLESAQDTINNNNRTIDILQNEINKLNTEIVDLTTSSETGDLAKAHDECNALIEEKGDLSDKKSKLNEERLYNEAIGEMLKDTGIKTKVIKQYLPVMNMLINKYLQTLDFFVAFNLDENFNETIKSRHRDEFNYSSFSEGEKQRIDLALLFTWRHIAKMKNSASTNLLVLDETFDSSLDVDGVENLTKILGTLDEDSSTFIISHKGDLLENKFENKLEFVKDSNFSHIK